MARNECFKIVSYNVAGLAGKCGDLNFIDYIKSFDIFFLCETFLVGEVNDKVSRIFSEYNIKFVSGIKTADRGRASGGELIGYNKNKLGNIASFVQLNNRVAMKIDIGGQPVFLAPVYLNGRVDSWEREWLELWDMIENNKMGDNLILIGDLNGRIAERQELKEELLNSLNLVKARRVSKDKVINEKGKRILEMCEWFNLVVLNGRMSGDEKGEMTYIGGMGESVIDLCCVSLDVLKLISDFRVGAVAFSDHMPVEVDIFLHQEGPVADDLAPLPKLHWSEDKVAEYETSIRNNIVLCKPVPQDVNEATNKVLEVIKLGAGNRDMVRVQKKRFWQVWYDWECERARVRSFRSLKLYRGNTCEFTKRAYLCENRYYKKLCRNKKIQFYRLAEEKISAVRDSKSFWSLVKLFKKQYFKISAQINPDVWSQHFSRSFQRNWAVQPIAYAVPWKSEEALDGVIKMGELKDVLKRAKSNKAPGIDGIPAEFFVNAPVELLESVLIIFNNILEYATVPQNFRKAVIFPILKKGDPGEVSNYRGISFVTAFSKLFAGILLRRIENWVIKNNVLTEYQAGFRKNYSTVDNIFNLYNIIKLKLMGSRNKVYAFFVDFRGAFDKIDRDLLWYKLYGVGFSNKIIRVIEELYKCTTAGVWCNGRVTDFFSTECGLKQGCVLSPICYSLFVNDISDYLEGGIWIEDVNIKVLLYADDLVVLASTPKDLQRMILNLKNYCETWGLEINTQKSKIMVFRKGGRLKAHEKWFFGSDEIEVVNKYKYLGVLFTPQLSFTEHVRGRSAMAKLGLNGVWKNYILKNEVCMEAKWKVFQSVSRAIATYGVQIWGFQYFDCLEEVQRFFVKRLLALPRATPNYVIYLGLNIDMLFLFTLKVHFNYILRVLKLPGHRLPRILAEKVIGREVGWYKGWLGLCEMYGCVLSRGVLGVRMWKDELVWMVQDIRKTHVERWRDRAARAQLHSLFNRLDLDLHDNNFLQLKFDRYKMGLIFKARGELLNLNCRYGREDIQRRCSLCNMNCEENTLHFIGVCPILKSIRKSWLGKYSLDEGEVIEWLNGKEWPRLVGYLNNACSFRKQLINEFNY